jgi:hypothetical protein
MHPFKKNYLYELPDDIQTIIYKKVYQSSLKNINDKRESMDNFNRLVEYINGKNNITPTKKKNETRLFIFIYLKTMF